MLDRVWGGDRGRYPVDHFNFIKLKISQNRKYKISLVDMFNIKNIKHFN